MTHRSLLALGVVSTLAVAGCSGAPPSEGQAGAGPHQGVIVPLPGDSGFAEVLTEEPAAKAPARRGHPPKAVVVYFLGPDQKAALSPAPTGVGVKILGNETAETVALNSAPAPKDPAGASRFASAVGNYDLAGRRAELSADVGGQKVWLEFRGPR
jgi:hypothetical protein